MLSAFIYGALLSLGLIIPLGIQNIFVLNQGARQRHMLGAMPSVLTAFICDVILILCAVLGISMIVLTIPWMKTLIFSVGIGFLLYMGWVTWRSQAHLRTASEPLSVGRQIGFAASVSLLNPHALLDTISVIGTNSLNFSGQEKWAYTLACILVSFCWFLSLSIVGHFFSKWDKSGRGAGWLNKLSSLIMWATACYLLGQLLNLL